MYVLVATCLGAIELKLVNLHGIPNHIIPHKNHSNLLKGINQNRYKVGIRAFDEMPMNANTLKLKCWYFRASEDIITKFNPQGLYVMVSLDFVW